MTDKNYIYKKLSDGRYIKEIDSKTEHLASAEEDAKLATDIRSLLQGVQGESGTSGTSGQDGTSGRDGAKGDIGRTGLTGPRGLNGTSGSSGSSGQDGSSGVNGQDGTSGVNGRKGEKGDKGDRGFPGLQGPAGQNGSAGVSGTSGTSAPGITSGSSGTSGTSGSSGMNGISAGQVYYFNKSQSSDVSPYKVLALSPSGTSQQTSTASLTGSQKGLLIDSYLTPELGFAVIPAGVQRFHHHLLKPASNDKIEFYVEIQLADSSGTPIGPTLSTNKSLIGWVDAVTPDEVNTDLVLPTTTIDPTSRMIVRLYLDNNDSTSHTVVHYTEGISYYSFVTTSVGVIGSTSGSSGTSGVNGSSGSSGSSGISGSRVYSFLSQAPGASSSNVSGALYVSSVITVPANTFVSSPVTLNLKSYFNHFGTIQAQQQLVYIGLTFSAPGTTLTAANYTLLATGLSSGTRMSLVDRQIHIYNLSGTGDSTKVYTPSNGAASDVSTSSNIVGTLAIDWSQTQYIHLTIRNVNATPTIFARSEYFSLIGFN